MPINVYSYTLYMRLKGFITQYIKQKCLVLTNSIRFLVQSMDYFYCYNHLFSINRVANARIPSTNSPTMLSPSTFERQRHLLYQVAQSENSRNGFSDLQTTKLLSREAVDKITSHLRLLYDRPLKKISTSDSESWLNQLIFYPRFPQKSTYIS